MSDSEAPTPRIQLLLSRLQRLTNDIALDMNRLVKRLGHLEEESVLTLLPATHNIVDRKKDKERQKKSYKVELKEIVTTKIDYDTLSV